MILLYPVHAERESASWQAPRSVGKRKGLTFSVTQLTAPSRFCDQSL